MYHFNVARTLCLLLLCSIVMPVTFGCGLGESTQPFNPFPTEPELHPEAKVLPVSFIRQETQVWCWAATAEMVLRHRHGSNAPRQCQILSVWMGFDCCFNPQACAVPAPNLQIIQQTLFGAGGLTSQLRGSAMPLSEIKAEIDAGRPMIAAYRGSFRVPFSSSLSYGSVGNPLFWDDTITNIQPL